MALLPCRMINNFCSLQNGCVMGGFFDHQRRGLLCDLVAFLFDGLSETKHSSQFSDNGHCSYIMKLLMNFCLTDEGGIMKNVRLENCFKTTLKY